MKYNFIYILTLCGSLGGCLNNMNNAELLGAASGGAVGGYMGSHFGQGLAKIASITAGTLIGGSSGTLGVRVLNKSDLFLHRKTADTNLSETINGEAIHWKNPETGSAGVFRPMNSYKLANGQRCRQFRTTIVFSDGIETGVGTACRQANGRWKIVSDDFS